MAAFEFLSMDPETASLLRQDKVSAMIEQLTYRPGNMTIHNHLARLIQAGQISVEEGYAHAFDHKALEANLKSTTNSRSVPKATSRS